MANSGQDARKIESLLSSGWTSVDGEGKYFQPPHSKYPIGSTLEDALKKQNEIAAFKAAWMKRVETKIATTVAVRRSSRLKVNALNRLIREAKSLAEIYGADGALATERLILDEEIPLIENAIKVFGMVL